MLKRIKATPDLRPLTARALTSILDTLRPEFPGSAVLDLFSGKGRFGLGALKEGARTVTFVEKDHKSSAAIKEEIQSFGEQASVYGMEVFSFLGKAESEGWKYDIVFADPPFRLWVDNFSEKLVNSVLPVLKRPAIFLVRPPKKVVVSLANRSLTEWKSSVFGESRIIYLTAQ